MMLSQNMPGAPVKEFTEQMKSQGIQLNAIQAAKAQLLDEFLRESAMVEAEAIRQNEELYKENVALKQQLLTQRNDHIIDLEQMETKLQGMELYSKELAAELQATKTARAQENQEKDALIEELRRQVADLESIIPDKDVMTWLKKQLDNQKAEYEKALANAKK